MFTEDDADREFDSAQEKLQSSVALQDAVVSLKGRKKEKSTVHSRDFRIDRALQGVCRRRAKTIASDWKSASAKMQLEVLFAARARAGLTQQLLVPVNRVGPDSEDNRRHNSCIIAANGHFPVGI